MLCRGWENCAFLSIGSKNVQNQGPPRHRDSDPYWREVLIKSQDLCQLLLHVFTATFVHLLLGRTTSCTISPMKPAASSLRPFILVTITSPRSSSSVYSPVCGFFRMLWKPLCWFLGILKMFPLCVLWVEGTVLELEEFVHILRNLCMFENSLHTQEMRSRCLDVFSA